MASRTILGLFRTADGAAEAAGRLREAGFSDTDYDVLTGSPYPEEAFGEPIPEHRLFIYPIIGALCGFVTGLLVTGGTQITYPLVTGGKPLLSIPPMVIITYEGTMLGAIIFTILGVIFESRLPNMGNAAYDPRIMTDGMIGLVVAGAEDRLGQAERVFRAAGAEDIVRERVGAAWSKA
jgi:hypothetical protein